MLGGVAAAVSRISLNCLSSRGITDPLEAGGRSTAPAFELPLCELVRLARFGERSAISGITIVRNSRATCPPATTVNCNRTWSTGDTYTTLPARNSSAVNGISRLTALPRMSNMPKSAFEILSALPFHEIRRSLPCLSTDNPSGDCTSVRATVACDATGRLEPRRKYREAPANTEAATTATSAGASHHLPDACRRSATGCGVLDSCPRSAGDTGIGSDGGCVSSPGNTNSSRPVDEPCDGTRTVFERRRPSSTASSAASKGNTINGQSKISPSPQKQKLAAPIVDFFVSTNINTELG